MFFYIALAIPALLAYYLYTTYRGFQVNLAAAKQSGLPYVCVPVYPFNTAWLITHRLWMSLVERLPHAWTDSWREYMYADFVWDHQYRAFQKIGSDMFMVVSPGVNTIYVADAEAVNQITSRRNDFPKPTWIYKSVDIYGKNVVSTEGAVWRHHRKVTSPPFTEKNNHLVWLESLHQAQSMMSGWLAPGETATGPLKDIATQAMRLSLHVISRAGFGVRLDWPHEEGVTQLPPGHTMSYRDAMSSLLENIIVVMLTPRLILNYSPLQLHRTASEAFSEWTKYMNEMYEDKREEVKNGGSREGMDLMGALVRGAGMTAESISADDKASPKASAPENMVFSKDEILGNAFVFILAGHETAANTIHFSILYLAMHWSSQKHLQDDLDAILGDRPASEWSYDDDMPRLFGSMCGAVMNEELRLIPPVVGIPKWVTDHSPQGLQVGGRHYTAPQGASITLNTPGLHRNPKYWPHTSEADLDEFRPERWIIDPAKGGASSTTNPTEGEAYAAEAGLDFDGPDRRPDTAASLFRPPKGAYIPFSDGYRSCLGRRFAQVEILAALAVIFKTWSVELDVSDWLPDDELATASEDRKREAWDKADARARDLLRTGMMTIITIQMRKDKVPLRFVKRGTERFKFG